jgi:hexulose-6-phosphate isomerase
MKNKSNSISRRTLLESATVTAAAMAMPASAAAWTTRTKSEHVRIQPTRASKPMLDLNFSVKYGMIQAGKTVEDKFNILLQLGFDGAELDSP